jgi:DnaJ-class molecular chaperone
MVYVNLRPGKALVCRTCEGRGGMDRMRPHIRDCAECGGLGAHQPEEAA